VLCAERPEGAEPWSDDDRALAALFARLAEMAAGSAHAAPAPPAAPPDAEHTAALRRSEAHFRRLIEHSSDLLLIAAPDLGITYVSPSAERLLGLAPDEMLGRMPADLLHPDDVPALFGVLGEALADPATVRSLTWRIRHQDGSWRVMEALARMLSPEEPGAGFLVNARDVTERRAMEEALRRSEERYRAVVESLNEVVFHSDAQGRWTFLNRAWSDVTGLSVEESVGRSFLEFAHPDDLPRCIESYQLLLGGGHDFVRHDVRFRHRDGGWRWIEVFVRAVRDGAGAVVGTTGTFNDVTAARDAEAALRASEERFRSLVENAHDIIAVLDGRTGHITYETPSLERTLGYAPGELAGQNALALVHPDDAERVAAEIAGATAEPGRTCHIEYRYRHRDGSWRYLESVGHTLSPTTAEHGLVLNTRDVTERKLAELALQHSESKYRTLVDAAQDMITVIDARGTVVFQSPSAERILGFAPEEMVGRDVMGFLHPDDVPMAVERMAKVMTHPGTIERVQYRSLCKDGSYRHVESTGRTVLPDSAAAGAVGIVRDVTARIEAEAALRRAKAEAERAHEEATRANRAKSEFLSRMSHELRTPLNSILGFAQVLEDVDLEPDYRMGVGYILSGGRHLLALIDEVLDIARIEADEQPLTFAPVRVADAVREAVDMVRPLAAPRAVRIVPPPDVGPGEHAWADRQRLTQVLLNLLSNAVKYNRPGGEVRIEVAAAAGGAGERRVHIGVHDQGPGIPPERQGDLFVPFARLGAEQTDVEGTGLGLALSQRLAQAMGGTLALERSGAEGSTFGVTLPAAPADRVPGERTAAGDGRTARLPLPPATLLLVEDNPASRALLEVALCDCPEWRLVSAPDGRTGLALAAEETPDLVLLDLHLPDMHGTEVLRALRARPATADVPVVVTSADATQTSTEALHRAGADAYLTKPLDLEQLVHTVERLLRRGGGR
jgi:PAS domain S-box-containing protein